MRFLRKKLSGIIDENLYDYVVKNSFWVTGGKLLVFIVSFVTLTLLARHVPKETVGTYYYILSITTILGIFTLPGLGQAIVRSIVRGKEGTFHLAVKTQLRWGILAMIIALAVSLWYFFHNNTLLGFVFLCISPLLPFIDTLNELSIQFWQAKTKFLKASFITFMYQIGIACLVIPAFFMVVQPLPLIFIMFFAPAAMGILVFLYTRTHAQKTESDPTAISFSKHLTVVQGILLLSANIDRILVWQYLGPIAVATYSFALLPIDKLTQLLPLQQIALPLLSKKEIEPFHIQSINKKLLLLFVVSGIVTLILIFIAPYFFSIFFPTYLSAIPYFKVLSLLFLFAPFVIISLYFTAMMRKRELYTAQFFTIITKIALLFMLIPKYHIWGVVFALVIAKGLEGIISYILFLRLIRKKQKNALTKAL